MIKSVPTYFFTRKRVQFGQAVYLAGNSQELGNWSPNSSHKLNHIQDDIWSCRLNIPVGTLLQYKYFIASFELTQSPDCKWEEGRNRIAYVGEAQKQMHVCSFNVRYLTENDQGKLHWDYRKKLITDYLDLKQYDFIGIQQATSPQRQYMYSVLSNDYQYFGKPRDLNRDEECGIFVHLDKFTVLSDEYCWISESKQQGSVGYDATLPRYFTSLTILPSFYTAKAQTQNSQKLPIILVINVHLDHQGYQAQQKGLEQIMEKIIQTKAKYHQSQNFQLAGCIVMGDFNVSEGSPMLSILSQNKQMRMISMRQIPGADKSFTFNGFQSKYLLYVGQLLVKNHLTIDHMFYWENRQQNARWKVDGEKFKIDRESADYMSDHFPLVGKFGLSSRKPAQVQEYTSL